MGNIGVPELIIILLVALLIFGGNRLGQIGRGLGEGIRNFRNAISSGKEEEKSAESQKNPKSTS